MYKDSVASRSVVRYHGDRGDRTCSFARCKSPATHICTFERKFRNRPHAQSYAFIHYACSNCAARYAERFNLKLEEETGNV